MPITECLLCAHPLRQHYLVADYSNRIGIECERCEELDRQSSDQRESYRCNGGIKEKIQVKLINNA